MYQIDPKSNVITIPDTNRDVIIHLTDGTAVRGWSSAPSVSYFYAYGEGPEQIKNATRIEIKDVIGWSEVSENVEKPIRKSFNGQIAPAAPLTLEVDGVKFNVSFTHIGPMTFCHLIYSVKRFHLPTYDIGVARCNPGDEYDPATGEKVAMKRACGALNNISFIAHVDEFCEGSKYPDIGHKLYSAYRKHLRGPVEVSEPEPIRASDFYIPDARMEP